ncbi:MAG: SpoVR family protein, partial [Proteobacteria bacterium]|nr:SpoVR family protein [Pseudomonadota bacterium]
RLMREFRLFTVLDDDSRDKLEVEAIHDESGYRALRRQLAEQYDLGSREPNLQVWNVDLRGDRSLTLRHFPNQRRPLGDSHLAVLEHLACLWGFTVRIEEQTADGQGRLIAERKCEKRRRAGA